MSDLVTYADGEPFSGVIGRTADESSPAWPTPPRAPEDAPNVVMFVLDDVGFGQLSSFGGLVETPVLDRFADNGLRYTNMHTTALCSPSRGAILTGRNHHSLGLATISETSTGNPGYNAPEGLTYGHDAGSRVAPEHYQDDFAFTGTLKRVTIDLSGDLIVDSDTDMKVAMARQ